MRIPTFAAVLALGLPFAFARAEAGPETVAAKKPTPTPAEQAVAFADAVDDALSKCVATVQESSVAIWNLRRGPTGPAAPGTTVDPKAVPLLRASGGSGVLVSWKGKGPYVITNEHVVRGADGLEVVAFGGETFEARLVDHVPQYDIAVLDFAKGKPRSWKAAKFGKSEALSEGQWVIATGNPFFLGGDGHPVATLGVISGLDRTIRAEFTYADAIQHDAEVNPGNSGGPLWTLAGELVGINGMISSRGDGSSVGPSNTGASFSIPIHLILGYFDDLLSEKVSATPGWLGLDVEDAKDRADKPIGAVVRDVRPGSPAARRQADPKTAVCLERGDLVTRIVLGGGIAPKTLEVWSATDYLNAIAPFRAGEKVKVTFERAGKKLTWAGVLVAAPAR